MVGLSCLWLAAVSIVASGCCKKPAPDSADPVPTVTAAPSATAKPNAPHHVHFNRVPLEVTIPAHWKQTQNTSWMVYRPDQGGALVAFTAEADCGLVERRLYSALVELGLTNVAWDGGPKHVQVNGLRSTVAEGTAIETSQLSYLKYALTYAPGGSGCLVTLYNVWKTKSGLYRAEADTIILSVERKQ